MNVKDLKTIYSKYKVVIIASGFAAVQVLFARAVEADYLKCPCEENYDMYKPLLALLLIVPCCVSLMIGLAINPNFWRLIMGCCSGNRCGTRPCCCSCKSVPCSSCFSCDSPCGGMECCYHPGMRCFRMFLFAIIFPIFWFIVITIDGDYWACVTTDVPYEHPENITCMVSLFSLPPKINAVDT